MANLTENTQNPAWSAGIYQIETSDPVLGGANGIANRQAKELAARTQWLKTELARSVALIGTNQQTAIQQFALKTTSLTAGAGLSGGGVLRDNMTLSLGTPSKITATSQNSAVSNTHTHEIDKASTSVAGIVRLNNTLTSTSTTEALTAAQGKALAGQIDDLGRNVYGNYVNVNENQTVNGVKTFSGSLNANAGIVARNVVKTSYNHEWVGFIANQEVEGKHVYFDCYVRDICRGSYQIVSEGGGRYAAKISVTPAGATNTDRRVVGMTITEGAVHTNGYGWLHEAFVRSGNISHTHYPNHYLGADVYKFKNCNLMIIIMAMEGLPQIYNLPEAFDGWWSAYALDRGSGNLQVSAQPAPNAVNNQVKMIAHTRATNVAWGVMCIGFKRS